MGKKLTPTNKNTATPPVRRSSRLTVLSSPPTVSKCPSPEPASDISNPSAVLPASPTAALSPTAMLPSSETDSPCVVSSSPNPPATSDLLIEDAVLLLSAVPSPTLSVGDSPVEAGNGVLDSVAEAQATIPAPTSAPTSPLVGPAVFAPSPTATIPTPDPEYVGLSLVSEAVCLTPEVTSPRTMPPVIVEATATTPAPENGSCSIDAACPSQIVVAAATSSASVFTAPSTGIPQDSAVAPASAAVTITPENISVLQAVLSHADKKRRLRQRYKMNKKMRLAAQTAAAPVANAISLSTCPPQPAEAASPLAGSGLAPENVSPSQVTLLSPADKKRRMRQRNKMNKRMRRAAAQCQNAAPAPAGATSPSIGPPATVAPSPVATTPATENVVVPATPMQVALPSLADKKRRLRQRYKMNKKLKQAARCQSEAAPSPSVLGRTQTAVDSPAVVVPIPEAVATSPAVVIPSITSNRRRRKNQSYKMNKKMKRAPQCLSAAGASPVAGAPASSVVDPDLATTTTSNATSTLVDGPSLIQVD